MKNTDYGITFNWSADSGIESYEHVKGIHRGVYHIGNFTRLSTII